jgi:hypothetical protein
MPDMLAIISKAVFEADAADASIGEVLPLSRYASANKALAPLAAGGRLVLVTVRSPDESLWLVAVLDHPKHVKGAWVATKNEVSITDLGPVKSKIRFASGVKITAKPGALGMSLQTPRLLADGMVELMTGKHVPKRASAKRVARAKVEHSENYVYKLEGAYSLAELEQLPSVDQRQFLAAAARYQRGKYRTVQSFFERFARESGEDISSLTFERWAIALKAKPRAPLYHLWIFLADNGTLFNYATATACPVHVVQGGFESTDGKPASTALARALDIAGVPSDSHRR